MTAADLFLSNLSNLNIRDSSFIQKYVDLVGFPGLFFVGSTHKHHVLPKSIAKVIGVPKSVYDDPTINIIELEIHDHVLAHYYLYKMLGGVMAYAFHRMIKFYPDWNQLHTRTSSVIIDQALKEAVIECHSPLLGKKMPDAMREKMKMIAANRPPEFYRNFTKAGNESKKGTHPSLETLKKMRDARLGKPGHLHTREELDKMRECHLGRIRLVKDGQRRYVFDNSDECKILLDAGWQRPVQNKRYILHDRLPRIPVMITCPVCGKEMDSCGATAHIKVCQNELNGYLTTHSASKLIKIHEVALLKFGKMVFPNKELGKDRSPVYWSLDEIESIDDFVKKKGLFKKRNRVVNGRRGRVKCVETGDVFESATAASVYYNKSIHAVRLAIRNNGTCGYHWERLLED
jgi:hypothetical protein